MAQLEEGRMMRIVTRNLDPRIPRGHWAAEPVVNYRVGYTHARTEEPPDRPGGIHGLIIMNSPDAWMINRFTNTAQHIVDPGPTTDIHMPLIASTGPKPYLESTERFELGTEYDFLREKGAEASKIQISGTDYDVLKLDIDGHTIVLLSHEGEQRPWRLSVRKGAEVILQTEYTAYETGLEPDEALFRPPAGTRVVEAKGREYTPQDPEPDDSATTLKDTAEPVIKWSGS